jgi:hypothetical protein
MSLYIRPPADYGTMASTARPGTIGLRRMTSAHRDWQMVGHGARRTAAGMSRMAPAMMIVVWKSLRG